MNLDHLHFDCNLHPFSACKLKSARTIWVSPEYLNGTQCKEAGPQAYRRFADDFAYMIPDGQIFDNLAFDRTDVKRMQAERYGGAGIERNGGGARCGNIGRFQVKGNGRNPLAGTRTGLHHSYGGYRAVYAIHEAIYSHVLGRIMPGGTAKVHGVMLTGSDAAYQVTTARGWGGLLVREFVVRPANFLRAGFFPREDALAANMLPDVARVRRANRLLMQRLGVGGFMQLLTVFLRNSAAQLTFARLARITHGAVTPSNMCFDGRWIDLTNTSFVNASENTMGGNLNTPSFYEEMYAPVEVMKECAGTFAKYNDVALDVRPLSQYYGSVAGTYMKEHLGYFFGFRYADLDAGRCDGALCHLRSEVLHLLSQGRTVHHAWPETLPPGDPALCVLDYLFAATAGSGAAPAYLQRSSVQPRDAAALLHAFRTIADAAFAGAPAGMDFRSFLGRMYVTAFKRAFLPALLYKSRLEKRILEQLHADDPYAIEGWMQEAIGFTDWAFPAPDSQDTVLFSSAQWRITYVPAHGRIDLHEVTTARVRPFATAGHLLDHVASQDSGAFDCLGFDLRPYLLRMLDVLGAIGKPPKERHG